MMEETSEQEEKMVLKQDKCSREQGDGATIIKSMDEVREEMMSSKPFTLKLECDWMQVFLFVVALASRTWQLGIPRAVVFDELHYAKFVSLYMKGIFFFDIYPPLGKLMFALVGSFVGFEGDISFDRIGAEYPASVPVYQLRLVPAVFGSLIVPLVYGIGVELKLSKYVSLFAASLILLDNAFIVQSRFILLEGMLIFFMALAVLSFLKFRHLSDREFSVRWWFWLSMVGFSLGCTLSIKYSGFFTLLLILFLISKDYWFMLADTSKSDFCLVKHFLSRVMTLLILPAVIYIGSFYIHLLILTKAGPHDNVMTSAFQASLEGGLAALTKGQPLYVVYGSQITLRNSHNVVSGKSCWLHSHAHVYPLRYDDQRGSSHQQQVTCYVYKDVNNWWIVKHPERNSLVIDEPLQKVKHGDVVQLIHGITRRALNSHDVAAPVTPQNQEVSCYIDYNISMLTQNLWRVEILNKEGEDDGWQTIKSQVRFIHVATSSALKVTGKQLPEWGFNQLEVSSDKFHNQETTVWNVEEHRYGKVDNKDQQVKEISQAEMIPLKPTHLSFWSKLWELQYKMFFSTVDAGLEHKFSSSPLEWPLMSKNVAYWMSPTSNAQIHFLGNPVIWCSATLSVMIYLTLLVYYVLRRQRDMVDITDGEWQHFIFIGELLVGGYLIHYLPHFLTDRTLFIYSYLPAVIFKVLTLAAVIEHLYIVLHRFIGIPTLIKYATVALYSSASWMFMRLSVFTYGSESLSAEQIQDLNLMESWDFLINPNLQQ